MAELAVGLIGAAATVGASTLATGSGFTGRHESSHREEIMDTRRNMSDFLANLQSGDVTPDEEREFLRTREEAIQRENQYHESIENCKSASWWNSFSKIKKKEVRAKKRLTRQSNHSLRSLNESMYSGSDTSSICASAGSPPRSNIAVDDIRDWTHGVADDSTTQPLCTHQDQLQFFMDALSLPAAGVSGPFVPQLMYKPHEASEAGDMAPIHFWVEHPSECGIPLSDVVYTRPAIKAR
ncbi:hypothetical protein B0H17DRAFT_704100 [Mycena rosella]|uniref:Uncharacterized protein n=1 Tax=Mycena rosella TaxID=1033263 RepID=A0AAD7DAP8_MYCRO|nr:hypothetical protein B0H17DRAFT_704100 [Mycena rosella]